MVMLVVDLVPIPFVFMVAVGLALVINFRHVSQQADQFKAHAGSVVSVVGMVLAAAVLTGVLSGTGMVEAMADWLIGVIPHSLGSHLAVITGLLSMPLTFLMSNDAFYFGVLPVLTETAANYGIDRKSTRLNSSHANTSYAVFCLKKKNLSAPAPHPIT